VTFPNTGAGERPFLEAVPRAREFSRGAAVRRRIDLALAARRVGRIVAARPRERPHVEPLPSRRAARDSRRRPPSSHFGVRRAGAGAIFGRTNACTADLTQVIGSGPELHGATWSPDGRRIAFSAWDGRRTSVYAVTVAGCAVVRIGPRINLNVGSPDWSSANAIAFRRDRTRRDPPGHLHNDRRRRRRPTRDGRTGSLP
jgi:WD40-like Beta Propeller Repeat